MITANSDYIQDLLTISPVDAFERKDISEAVEWLEASVQVHKPHNMDQHLGVVFFIISPDASETFLIHHKKAGLWLPPGGHVQEGQSFKDAVREEMTQEIGAALPLVSERPFFFVKTFTVGKNAGHIDATAYFISLAEESTPFVVEEKEASDGKWFAVSDIIGNPEFTHLERPLRKALEVLNA